MIKVYVGKIENVPTTIDRRDNFYLVHPRDFKERIKWMRSEDKEFEFWTNNSDILMHCDWDEIVVCDSEKNHKSFKDHPQFNKWKDELAPGEFWSMFGEDWDNYKSSSIGIPL